MPGGPTKSKPTLVGYLRVSCHGRFFFGGSPTPSKCASYRSQEFIVLIVLSVVILSFLILVAGFGLGMYLGWFNIGTASADGKDSFRFTMDTDRKNAAGSTEAGKKESDHVGPIDKKPGVLPSTAA